MTFLDFLAYLFAMTVSLVLPLGLAFFFGRRRRCWRPMLLGAACFLVFQVCTRLPLIQYVLPLSAGIQLFQLQQPLLWGALMALSAGLFEECGRYATMALFLKKGTFEDSLLFGLGHGGIEAILLTALPLLPLYNSGGVSQFLLLSGLERLSAMGLHLAFSALVWRSRDRRPWLLLLAVLLHGAVDFLPLLLRRAGLNLFLTELTLLVCAGLGLLYLLRLRKCVFRKDTQS